VPSLRYGRSGATKVQSRDLKFASIINLLLI